MATCIVTGAAGFVGSHLSELLIKNGHSVIGMDAFIPYYPRTIKEDNLATLRTLPEFTLHEVDFRTDDLTALMDGADVVFHLAAQAGLLKSWSDFDSYMTCNVQATQRLLEAATAQKTLPHFINLAAENLCWAYADKDGLPVSVARLYSVYGPRQRPDMGYNIFIRAILNEETITIFGDGEDSRSNTYVTDCARGIMLIMDHADKSIGETFNIGGAYDGRY